MCKDDRKENSKVMLIMKEELIIDTSKTKSKVATKVTGA